MVLGKYSELKRPTNLLIWIKIGQGSIALAVGVGWGCLDIFFSRLSFLSHSLGDGPIQTEILSQRAVKPKTTNQPNPVVTCMRTPVYSCYIFTLKFWTKMRVQV